MRILDKYILKNIITTYVFILAVFICLYFIIDISTNLSDILKTKPPIKILVQFYLNMLPLIYLTVSPFSIAISVFYTFGELNRSNEVLSMRASGISIFNMSFPVIFFAVIISCASLIIQEKILIASQKKVEDIRIRFIKKNFAPNTEEINIAFSFENTIFFAGKYIPKKKTFYDVMIFEENETKNISKKTICKYLVYDRNIWKAQELIEYQLDEKGNITAAPGYWKERIIPLREKPETLVLRKGLFFQFSSLKNLKKDILQLKKIKAYDKLAHLIIDYHRRLVEPLSPFFIIMGTLPFALEIKKRRAAFSSLGVGIIFGFIYYTFMYFSIALGKGGMILPIFSPWLAPIFFITVGISGLIFIK